MVCTGFLGRLFHQKSKQRLIMIAKIRATEKEIVVEPYGDEFVQILPDGDYKVYIKQELEFPEDRFDWQQVRIQAAIAAMQGMIVSDAYANTEISNSYTGEKKRVKWDENKIAKAAIAHADALVAELKK